jgi:hypothetical protein
VKKAKSGQNGPIAILSALQFFLMAGAVTMVLHYVKGEAATLVVLLIASSHLKGVLALSLALGAKEKAESLAPGDGPGEEATEEASSEEEAPEHATPLVSDESGDAREARQEDRAWSVLKVILWVLFFLACWPVALCVAICLANKRPAEVPPAPKGRGMLSMERVRQLNQMEWQKRRT